MKRAWLALVVLLSLLMAGLAPAAHAQSTSTQDFTINSFTANYYLDRLPSGVPTMKIDEQIEATFPQYNQNHGILRALPENYKNQPLDPQVQSITDAVGTPYHYSTSQSNGNLVLKIGDPAQYVHGDNVYHIIYTIQNPISFYGDHDELYWNVNGTQWSQPFGPTTVQVHIPTVLAKQLQDRQACYTGLQGSTASDCTMGRATEKGGTIINATTPSLSPGGNLSIVLGFTKGTFAIDKAAQQAKRRQLIMSLAAFIIPPLAASAFLFTKWWKHGRDPKGKGTIIPQYTSPKELNSLTSDVILQEKLRQQAVTALVIDLAIRGYISISEIQTDKLIGKKTDYQLTVVRAPDGLNADEKAVMEMYFTIPAPGTTVLVSALARTMSRSFLKLSKSVPVELTTGGYFAKDPTKAVSSYRLWGVILTLAGFGLFFVARNLPVLRFLCLGIGLGGALMAIFAGIMSARTAKGVLMREYLLGLRDFIKVAEADRIKYLQSPAGVRQWGDANDPQTKVKLFEKLLPYAMIFGIEKDWAAAFQNVYASPPDWYQGNWTTFNTGYLIGSLNNFGSASAAVFAPPSSSSSSGFGGGGFSGGGGGGGGGGGW